MKRATLSAVLSIAAVNKLGLTLALPASETRPGLRLRRPIRIKALLIAAIPVTTAPFATVSSPESDRAVASVFAAGSFALVAGRIAWWI